MSEVVDIFISLLMISFLLSLTVFLVVMTAGFVWSFIRDIRD